MDGEVPWQFDPEPVDGPAEPFSDGQLAGFEAELIDDLDRLGGSGDWNGPVEPVDWRRLTAAEAEAQWRALDEFVAWLRTTYGLPPTVVPPLWHRHPELVEELSALHTHRLACYEPGSSGSGPLAWHADFADARERPASPPSPRPRRSPSPTGRPTSRHSSPPTSTPAAPRQPRPAVPALPGTGEVCDDRGALPRRRERPARPAPGS
jgi:hypothetical protein